MFSLCAAECVCAEPGKLSKSQAREYIESFVNASVYASLIQTHQRYAGGTGIYQLGLQTWIDSKVYNAWRDYDDALDHGANAEQLKRLMDRADHSQAIQTCIATRDCSRLRAIEAKDRERRDDAVSVNTTNTPTATASAELTRGGIIRVLLATYGLNCEDF